MLTIHICYVFWLLYNPVWKIITIITFTIFFILLTNTNINTYMCCYYITLLQTIQSDKFPLYTSVWILYIKKDVITSIYVWI